MIYVYPRKIIIKIGNYKIRPSYPFLVFGDLLIHQLPLAYVFYIENQKKINNSYSEDKTCGAWVLLPFTGWALTTKLLKVNVDKIYGIKMNYLIATSITIFTTHTLFHHFYFVK